MTFARSSPVRLFNIFSPKATPFIALPSVVLPFLASTYCGSDLGVSFHLPSDEVFSHVRAGLKSIIFSLKIQVLTDLLSHGRCANNNFVELSKIWGIQGAVRFINSLVA